MIAIVKKMVSSGTLLALFAILGATLLAFTYDNTKERIAANERAALLHIKPSCWFFNLL